MSKITVTVIPIPIDEVNFHGIVVVSVRILSRHE